MNISRNPGLYIHIPFCQKKCGYCDFYSVEGSDHRVAPFVSALAKEIVLKSKHLQTDAVFDTIYLGGGTPSLLQIADLEEILNTLSQHFNVSENCETTIEVNPGTIEPSEFARLRKIGFNRLSIGVQSFIDRELQRLGRIHNVAQAENAIINGRQGGFSNVSIDLIFALPEQTFADWQISVQKAIDFQPEHLSVYNLIYEPDTPFYSLREEGKIAPLDEQDEVDFFSFTHSELSKAGYLHYEVSNYARSAELVSRHNYKYWDHTCYLGFGPSAHSFWQNERWGNDRSLTTYIERISRDALPIASSETLQPE
ncbi:MAG: radical SAM family heme chaperone HemW, partial [Calditrichales bacterium]